MSDSIQARHRPDPRSRSAEESGPGRGSNPDDPLGERVAEQAGTERLSDTDPREQPGIPDGAVGPAEGGD